MPFYSYIYVDVSINALSLVLAFLFIFRSVLSVQMTTAQNVSQLINLQDEMLQHFHLWYLPNNTFGVNTFECFIGFVAAFNDQSY